MKKITNRFKEIIDFCKSRGFFSQSSDLYGGLDGVFDFGPLGVELKNHLKNSWWSEMVYQRNDVVGLDGAILSHPLLLDYSGHITAFEDPLVACMDCLHEMRQDHVYNGQCDQCKSTKLSRKGDFNMMFRTNFGTDNSHCYLRPATAQQAYACFNAIAESENKKVPYGIVQIGKAFRNEIKPDNFPCRMREFEQMELQYFIPPETDEYWHKYWLDSRLSWWGKQGIPPSKLHVVDVPKSDLAHYSNQTFDIYYEFDHGYMEEIEGIANRTDYDLTCHNSDENIDTYHKLPRNKDSKQSTAIVDPETNDIFIPWVIEPSTGVERALMAVLFEAYDKVIDAEGQERVVLRIMPHLSPVKAAIIVSNDSLLSVANIVKRDSQAAVFGRIDVISSFDTNIDLQYQFSIGTPICFVINEVDNGNFLQVKVFERDTDITTIISLPEIKTKIL